MIIFNIHNFQQSFWHSFFQYHCQVDQSRILGIAYWVEGPIHDIPDAGEECYLSMTTKFINVTNHLTCAYTKSLLCVS